MFRPPSGGTHREFGTGRSLRPGNRRRRWTGRDCEQTSSSSAKKSSGGLVAPVREANKRALCVEKHRCPTSPKAPRPRALGHRVASPHCWGPALSEPDVTVSRHPAQALRTPLSGRRGCGITAFTIRTWSRRTLRCLACQSMAYHSAASLETAPTACAVVICFASYADLPRSLVCSTSGKSARFRAR